MKFKFYLFSLSFILAIASFVHASEKETIAKIVDEANKKGEFSGVVLIAKDDEDNLQRRDGLANRQWNIPKQSKHKIPHLLNNKTVYRCCL